MKTTINWGILGTSYISEIMANAIQESQTSRLIAIGSRSLTKANHFSNQFSIPKVYDDYQDLLDDKEIDTLYLGLPNHLHKEWIIRCANAGKHILCEKPFVTRVEEMKEVISILRKSNVFCMEALMYRYHPFIQKLQEIIQSQIIGDIKLYHAVYTAPIADIANQTAGGSIRNLGCYPVSLVRLLANSEPVKIQGAGRINPKNNNDNQASVILTFADESMAVISTADDIKMVWQFDVFGTKGSLKIVTNPWLPDRDHNKILIYLNDETMPLEINVTAEKSLYTYQIDAVNTQIMNKNPFSEKTIMDSLGNTIVLENWLHSITHHVKDIYVNS